jgi:SAM-dependent methyltransferase
MITAPSPFEGTAEYYAKYRPGIPSVVVDYLRDRFHLDGSGSALDLGCGTGQLTFALAPHMAETVGLDPDAEMIGAAQKEHLKHDAAGDQIRWEVRAAESITPSEGPYKLVTMCRAFVWMDQYPVLRRLKDVICTGGGVAIIGDGSFWSGSEGWQKGIKRTVQSFLGEARKAGKSGLFFDTGEPYTDMLRKTGYQDVQRADFKVEREWSFEAILGCLYSTSFAAKSLFGDRIEEFEAALFTELGEPADAKKFLERGEFAVQSGVI